LGKDTWQQQQEYVHSHPQKLNLFLHFSERDKRIILSCNENLTLGSSSWKSKGQ